MNILPHKSWHVRTKKNIARVRQDEAKAAEEKKEEQRRILLAEQEARTDILRTRARERYDGRAEESADAPASTSTSSTSAHVNLFEELESGPSKTSGKNAEHEKEAKEEREKYEKSVGYLTYLGQDTVESTGIRPWYDKRPTRLDKGVLDESKSSKKKKIEEDPLRIFAAFAGIKKPEFKEREIEFRKHNNTSVVKNVIKTELGIKSLKRKIKDEKAKKRHSKKNKKEKKIKNSKKDKKRKYSYDSDEKDRPKSSSAASSVSIEKLRAERIAREQAEKARAAALLAKINGTPLPEEPKPKEDTNQIKQKYNSQFNPHLARQNFEDADPWNNQPWNRR